MKNWIALLILAAATIGMAGCSMCCGPFDYDYPAFGGVNPRVDQRNGRLGSIFSDPNAYFTGESADSNLAPRPEPIASSSTDDESDEDSEAELEKIKRELENDRSNSDLNSDGDLNDGEGIGSDSIESLPAPEPSEDTTDGGTASRIWKNRPLRSKGTWR